MSEPDYTTGRLLIVNFHHIRPHNPPQFAGLHHRTVEQFEQQITVLAREYEMIGPVETRRLLGTHDTGRSRCLLTFDDGLRDHHDWVFPTLEKHGISGMFCVNTRPWEDGQLLSVHMAHLLSAAFGYEELASSFERAAWDLGACSTSIADVPAETAAAQYRWDTPEVGRIKFFLNAVIPQNRRADVLARVFAERFSDSREYATQHYLSPAMVTDMAKAGHGFGLHTHDHLHLASATREQRLADLKLNRSWLERATEATEPIRWVSYPYGGPSSFDNAVIEDSLAEGCDVGLTAHRGINSLAAPDRMRLLRLDTHDAIGGRDPYPPALWATEAYWSQTV